MRAFLLCSLALAAMPGCAAGIDGTTQDLTVRTAPVGSSCTVQRGPTTVGVIASTPGTLVLDRTQESLTVVCNKPGWATTVKTIRAKPTGVTVGNFFLGGFTGLAIDHEVHADYRYDDDTIILMTPPNAPG